MVLLIVLLSLRKIIKQSITVPKLIVMPSFYKCSGCYLQIIRITCVRKKENVNSDDARGCELAQSELRHSFPTPTGTQRRFLSSS